MEVIVEVRRGHIKGAGRAYILSGRQHVGQVWHCQVAVAHRLRAGLPGRGTHRAAGRPTCHLANLEV